MKKILFFASALAGLFLAGSCQQESLEPVADGGVTYTITLPEAVQTKGASGYSEYDLYYEVYKTVDADELKTADILFEKKVEMTGNTTTLTLDLLNDQDYTILFWANKKGESYFNVADLRNVEMVQAASNNNDRDAFCGMDQLVNFDAAMGKTVTLRRPFAQLNIATIVSTTAGYDLTPLNSYVKVSKIPVAYNVATASPVGEDAVVEYTKNTVPAGKKVNDKYDLVAMNYVLVPEGNIEVYYEIETVNGTVKNTVANVPVKPNYRTNIIGNLLTSSADYTVEIKPGFDTPAEEVEVWNGDEINEPNKNDDGEYEITKASELAWLAAAVNGTVPTRSTEYEAAKTFAGETFVLTEDIDLGNYPWTPIGLTGDMPGFKGTFDGQGHTISNLYVDLTAERKYQSAGLFGSVHGTVKNFTVKNATVKNLDDIPDTSNGTAVVVGASQYESTIENVHVVNAVVSANKRAAGIAGYFCGTITGCTVDGLVATTTPDKKSDGTYDNGDKIGGIVAYDNTPGTAIDRCSVKNAHIEGYRDLGGISGTARLSITNCIVENVDIVHNPLNGYKTSVDTFGAIHSGRVTPSGDVTTGNQIINVTIYAPENVTVVKPGESLQAAVDAAAAPAVIYLAEGTHTGHTVINKDITLLPVEGAKVVYDGHMHINNTTALIKGITLTNEHPSATTVQASTDAHLACASSYTSNVTFEDCTFDIKSSYGYYHYQGDAKDVIKNCIFNCNGNRPMFTRTKVDVEGCKFYDQYRYAIQVKGEISDPQVVNFKNNQIINPCVTSGKGFVAGVSISGSQKCENVTFNIEGNTLTSSIFSELVYVYDNKPSIDIASCTVNGATFVREDQVPVITFVTPSELATTDFTKSGTYMLMGDFSGVTSMPSITPTEGVVAVIDASGATFGDKIQFNIPAVPDNSNVVSRDNARKGSYTLTNFHGTTLDLGAYGTSVTITKSTLDCIDVFAANIALDINHNTIDSNYEMHPRCNSGETDYAVYMMMMAYDLKFDGNTASNAIGHVVAINGSKGTWGTSVANSGNEVKSFTGNTITGISGSTKNNRAGFKVWDDLTYAFQGESTYEALPQAGQALINAVENANTFKKAEGTSNNAYKINFYEYYHAAL